MLIAIYDYYRVLFYVHIHYSYCISLFAEFYIPRGHDSFLRNYDKAYDIVEFPRSVQLLGQLAEFDERLEVSCQVRENGAV